MIHSAKHSHRESLASVESSLNLTVESFRDLGEFDILTHLTILLIQKRAESIRGDVHQRVLLAVNEGNVSGMGGWHNVFVLLIGKNINGGEVALGVAVLSSLGGGHINDLKLIRKKQLHYE